MSSFNNRLRKPIKEKHEQQKQPIEKADPFLQDIRNCANPNADRHPQDMCDNLRRPDVIPQKRTSRLGKQASKRTMSVGKRRAKTTDQMRLVRETTYPYVWGYYSELQGHIRPNITKYTYLAYRKDGKPLKRLRLANWKLQHHFFGLVTYYYYGNGRKTRRYTLVMLDIDVNKSGGIGSTEGAWAFAKWLAKVFGADLYCESSTHGEGVHCYLVMDKLGKSAKQVNEAIDVLNDWMHKEAMNFDVELAEAKGKCLEWGRDTVKYGTFAKVPRNMTEGTATITYDEIMSGKFAVPKIEKRKNKLNVGSTTFDVRLDARPEWQPMLLLSKCPKIYKRAIVLEDCKVFLGVLDVCKKHPNPDGSLPAKRLLSLWRSVYEEGKTSRAPNYTRIKIMRDTLSLLGGIQWQSAKYSPVAHVACKWQIADDAFVHVNEDISLSILIDTSIKIGSGEYHIPVMQTYEIDHAYFASRLKERKRKKIWTIWKDEKGKRRSKYLTPEELAALKEKLQVA